MGVQLVGGKAVQAIRKEATVPTGYFTPCRKSELYEPSCYAHPAERPQMNGALRPEFQAGMHPMKVGLISQGHRAA